MTGELRPSIFRGVDIETPRYVTASPTRYKVIAATFVELPSGKWFIREETTTENQIPTDFYLRELREVLAELDSINASYIREQSRRENPVIERTTVEREIALMTSFVSDYGIFSDTFERDVPSLLGLTTRTNDWRIVGFEGLLNEAWNIEKFDDGFTDAKEQAILEAGLPHVTESERWHSMARLNNLADLRFRFHILKELSRLGTWIDNQTEDFGVFELSRNVEYLNAALRVFAPRIDVPNNSFGVPEANIFNLAALQIATDLRDGLVARECERDGCSTLFIRQRGRAKHEIYRTRGEMKYCSHAHAKAQASQDARDRQAALEGRPKRGRGRPRKDEVTTTTKGVTK